MDLRKYNNLLTYRRWYTKVPKNAQILALVEVEHNLMYNFNNNHIIQAGKKRELNSCTKVYSSYIK